MASNRRELDFEHFIQAQHPCYARVLAELRAGEKQTHWMWFIFPQLQGLGQSEMAYRFGLADLDAARAYLAHPVLGPRLIECASIVLQHRGVEPESIFGTVDAMKLRSCMTLFDRAAPTEAMFKQVLEQFYEGKPDAWTLRLLAGSAATKQDKP